MKRVMPLIGLLVAIYILPLLAEQSNISEPDDSAIEPRLTALEERIDAIEQRINQLEESQHPTTASPTEPNSRIEKSKMRCNKKIQELKDAIELIKTQLENLPFENESLPFENLTGEYRLKAIEREWRSLSDQELKDRLEAAQNKFRLLAEEELDYTKIIQLTQRYPYLDVDVMAVKKDLIACQGDKEKTNLYIYYLRRILDDRNKETNLSDYHHERVRPVK